jgi:predicted MFS family arabinose efflux permease
VAAYTLPGAVGAAVLQSVTTTANLPSVLAARSAALVVATPLGTAIGGPIVASLGARSTLTASGAATVVLAGLATLGRRRAPQPATA